MGAKLLALHSRLVHMQGSIVQHSYSLKQLGAISLTSKTKGVTADHKDSRMKKISTVTRSILNNNAKEDP